MAPKKPKFTAAASHSHRCPKCEASVVCVFKTTRTSCTLPEDQYCKSCAPAWHIGRDMIPQDVIDATDRGENPHLVDTLALWRQIQLEKALNGGKLPKTSPYWVAEFIATPELDAGIVKDVPKPVRESRLKDLPSLGI